MSSPIISKTNISVLYMRFGAIRTLFAHSHSCHCVRHVATSASGSGSKQNIPIIRTFSSSNTASKSEVEEDTKTNQVKKVKIPAHSPTDITRDWIGPPDPQSNLRPIKFFIPKEESENEQKYRLLREETQKFNQEFWARHNESFIKSREAFKKEKLREKVAANPDKPDVQVTAEEMSQFYKKFLDENYKSHFQYNRDWYKRNISLLWPAFKVTVERFLKRKSKIAR